MAFNCGVTGYVKYLLCGWTPVPDRRLVARSGTIARFLCSNDLFCAETHVHNIMETNRRTSSVVEAEVAITCSPAQVVEQNIIVQCRCKAIVCR